jgi:hypothetical protein
MEDVQEKFVNLWPVEARFDGSDIATDKELTPEDGGLQLESESPGPLLVEREEQPVAMNSVVDEDTNGVSYEMYDSELQMPDIMKLMKTALSEPYSIYTYRYFIHNWPQLCVLAKCEGVCVGAIVCKLEMHNFSTRRGYIAMLAVDERYRKRKIGKGSLAVHPIPPN